MLELIPYIAIIVSIIGLLIATLTDLKERIVPNKLNYGLTIIGLALFGSLSIAQFSTLPIAYSIIGLASGFMFGWVLWKIGVFAGGDVKLFMGLGALNPFTPSILKAGIFSTASIPLFPISLFVYALLAFLPYGMFVLIYKLYKNKKSRKEILAEMKPKIILSIHGAIFAACAYVILTHFQFFGQTPLITLIPIVLWGFLRKYKKYATIAGIIISAWMNIWLLLIALISAMIFSVLIYTAIKLMLSSRRLLVSEIEVKKLEEGMIPAKSLAWKGKKIIQIEAFNFNLLIKNAVQKKMGALTELVKPQKEIISARKARGLNEEELKELKKFATKGLIPKKLLIKESMPFVPTMLLGYLICLFAGDAVFFLIIGVF
ncbi:MAG: prepilin peptidase [Candidatus Diapherotrites archaeon]|nr:prepilin peptidase [Candidatus Diapherotrites archaeon]